MLKKDFRHKKRANAKLDVNYLGPYTITKVLGKGTYSLELIADPLHMVVEFYPILKCFNRLIIIQKDGCSVRLFKPYSTPPSPMANQIALESEVRSDYFLKYSFFMCADVLTDIHYSQSE